MDEIDLELAEYPDDGDFDTVDYEDGRMAKIEDVLQLLDNPREELVDYAIHLEGDNYLLYEYQPCHMGLGGALHSSLVHDLTKGYIRVPAKGIYLQLRLPSKYAMGMDIEDDINRSSSSDRYVWQFEKRTSKLADAADDKAAVEYWDYIFDPKYSPYRNAIIDNNISNKYIYNSNKEVIGRYLEVNDTIDAQVFVSLAMASRLPWQSLGHLRVWAKMREEGYKRYESFWVGVHIRFIADQKHLAFRTVAGHFPFAAYDTRISIDWLKAGTPNTRGLKITKDHYGSVDEIWDLDKKTHMVKSYVPRNGESKIENCKLYSILSMDAKYTGTFGKMFQDKTGSTSHKGGTCGTWDVVSQKLKESYEQWSKD
jgi:hypothetical protein